VDIVHEPYLGVRAPLAVPAVVTVHDTMPLDFPDLVPRTFAAYFRRAMPVVLERAAAIIVNSTKTKEDVMRHFRVPREKIHVTYLGADHIRPPGDEAGQVLSSLGLAGKRYFLAVGGLPTKNLPYTVEAFQRFREKVDSGVTLAVAGTLPKALELEMFSDPDLAEGVLELGRVDRAKLPVLYARSLALLHPSLSEGFGLPPLEAMAAGAPAIVSNRGALPEVCADAALVVELDDPQTLTDAMAKAIDPAARGRLIERGRARAAQFKWRSTALGTLLVYRSLVAPVGAPPDDGESL
jgi:glycosyltransferase involved in cell wall biosynthesis